eukprot:179576-Chlamydomonas_euryale.AAC.1
MSVRTPRPPTAQAHAPPRLPAYPPTVRCTFSPCTTTRPMLLLLATLFHEISRPMLLLLATLFHEISAGKKPHRLDSSAAVVGLAPTLPTNQAMCHVPSIPSQGPIS